MSALLELRNVEVVYHSVVRVLEGVSLAVAERAIVALLGPNGAGKTTTLRAISGLLPIHEGAVTKGAIELDGRSVAGQSAPARVAVGLAQVMEGRRVFADLSVEENLLAGGVRRPRAELASDLERAYRRFPILAARRRQAAGLLSGGEQQQLAIARSLMSRPRLLLLDEPSLGLAPKVAREVAAIIAEIREQDGVAILLVEQNARLALDLADRGLLLENGRVVLEGSAAELKQDRDVREFYLGISAGGRKSFREVKRYRRRKRWLS